MQFWLQIRYDLNSSVVAGDITPLFCFFQMSFKGAMGTFYSALPCGLYGILVLWEICITWLRSNMLKDRHNLNIYI